MVGRLEVAARLRGLEIVSVDPAVAEVSAGSANLSYLASR